MSDRNPYRNFFCLLGKPDITKRQDPVSWDKLLEMFVNYANILLGHHINTRKMNVSVPFDYLSTLNNQLTHWHSKRQLFAIPKVEPIIGKLGHAAQTLRWPKRLMGHLYTSFAAAPGASNQHLLLTSKLFCKLMEMIKAEPETWDEELCFSFSMCETT